MLFPVVVYKDKDSCFGVTIPDIPGCFSAGGSLIRALENVQDAVEAHLGESEEIPVPSDMEKLVSNPDYAGGVWVMVDIDFSFMEGKAVRVNITVPQRVLHEIDRFAAQIGTSRSAFLVASAKIVMTAQANIAAIEILSEPGPKTPSGLVSLYSSARDGLLAKKEETAEISNRS